MQAVRAITIQPRNTLGMAILYALNQFHRLVRPLREPPTMRERVEASAQRIDEIRKQEERLRIVDSGDMKVDELRDSVTRSEAQANFEASMRARQVRDSLGKP